MRARLVPLLLGFAACSEAEPFQARFAVRGRWEGARELRLYVETEPGPLADAEFTAALEDALATWAATGLVSGRRVATQAEADVVLGWRRGAHGDCASFGADPSVAHAGPVGPGTFVHFDAGRLWSRAGRNGTYSLEQAALHELGHVLGLDHTPDEASVMYPEPAAERTQLSRADLAGLQALYGDAEPGPGGLTVLHAAGERALVLPDVAPPEWCAFDVFDVDGDGDEELLVWRTDSAPLAGGALWQYHFGPGPVLARTVGPLYGTSAPGARLAFVRAHDGTRLAELTSASGTLLRRFDASGLLQDLEEEPVYAAPTPRADPEECRGDLDGDGSVERVRRGASTP